MKSGDYNVILIVLPILLDYGVNQIEVDDDEVIDEKTEKVLSALGIDIVLKGAEKFYE